MLTCRITPADLTPIRSALDLLARPDLGPLAQAVIAIADADVKGAVLAGEDQDGSATAPLRPSTLRTRGGDGPARAPQGAGSRICTALQWDQSPTPLGGILVTGSWPGFDAVRFFQTGTRYMAARDPVGLRPQTEGQFQQAADDYAARLAGGVP